MRWKGIQRRNQLAEIEQSWHVRQAHFEEAQHPTGVPNCQGNGLHWAGSSGAQHWKSRAIDGQTWSQAWKLEVELYMLFSPVSGHLECRMHYHNRLPGTRTGIWHRNWMAKRSQAFSPPVSHLLLCPSCPLQRFLILSRYVIHHLATVDGTHVDTWPKLN